MKDLEINKLKIPTLITPLNRSVMSFEYETTLTIEYKSTLVNAKLLMAEKPSVDIILGYKLFLRQLKEAKKFPVDCVPYHLLKIE